MTPPSPPSLSPFPWLRISAIARQIYQEFFAGSWLKSSSDGQMGEDEIEIDIDALSHETLYKLGKLLDDYLLKKQKNQAKAESCEIELLNESGFSNSSMQPCKGNDQIDEVVDIVGSSYPPVAIEKELTHRNSRCCSSSGSSGESGSSSSVSTKGATIFSGADRSQMYEYGKNLGLSFQVVDDILDFTQSAEQLGKPASSDLAKGNLTAPVIFALEKEPKLRDMIEFEFCETGSLDKAIELVKQCGGIKRHKSSQKRKLILQLRVSNVFLKVISD
ncbi:Solanesyl diphosphate synthase 1 [Gossypium arboreum]|uniref:Solanesyl diphosphate synthase 1 n=1 Tax=Gossypium arboreum TaxID=29729 RepID=A0A0B0N871_GOSAR|nr:Solanesyl diphosphate synthase 1 [Gossypium arboreum]